MINPKKIKKILPWNIPRSLRLHKWRKDKGDEKLRVDYTLDKNSIVFDVGGYKGDWSEVIAEKYDPYIYIFEPVTEYYTDLVNKFSGNDKIKVFNFGLSDKNEKKEIGILAESSSIHKADKGITEMAKFRDIHGFIQEVSVAKIDLIKINIEGGEYDVLPRIIEAGDLEICRNIQVQFHSFVDDASKKMKDIQKELTKTHEPTYQYKFVWENWRIKE